MILYYLKHLETMKRKDTSDELHHRIEKNLTKIIQHKSVPYMLYCYLRLMLFLSSVHCILLLLCYFWLGLVIFSESPLPQNVFD